jgi:hypothetical protein
MEEMRDMNGCDDTNICAVVTRIGSEGSEGISPQKPIPITIRMTILQVGMTILQVGMTILQVGIFGSMIHSTTGLPVMSRT